MKLSVIVAMSENRVIGKENQLPWKISEDLKRFRAITTGHPIIMGRKTFESIGRVLPQRENWIISRQKEYQVPGAYIGSSLEGVLKSLEGRADEVFIIGGAEIYRLALPRVQRIYLTLVHQKIDGDAFFPELSLGRAEGEFHEISRESHEALIPFSFILLERVAST